MDINKYTITDLELLTDRQKEVFSLLLKGKTQAEIAELLNCSKQNINCIIKYGINKIERGEREKPDKKPKGENQNPKSIIQYKKYKDYDMSVLTDREKEIIKLRIAGLQYREIADITGISISAVGAMLQKAREKLEGKETYSNRYYQKNREKLLESRKEYNKEYNKKYYQKNREKLLESRKKYNKKYYQKNREKLLERQKQRRENKY